jgi:hypothetical protein
MSAELGIGDHQDTPEGPPSVCKAIGIRAIRAMRVPVTPETASVLGIGVYGPDLPEEGRRLLGVIADCAECDGMVCVDVDADGLITNVGPLGEEPTFDDTCRTSFGHAIMDSLQRPV